MSILNVWLGPQYTLSVNMLLDRFGQLNKFWKKNLKKFWDIQTWVLWNSSRGRSENVLGTSRINLPGTSLERHIRTFHGRHFRTFPGRQIRTSPGWSNRIIRRRREDVEWRRPRDVLRTNICRLSWALKIPFIKKNGEHLQNERV